MTLRLVVSRLSPPFDRVQFCPPLADLLKTHSTKQWRFLIYNSYLALLLEGGPGINQIITLFLGGLPCDWRLHLHAWVNRLDEQRRDVSL